MSDEGRLHPVDVAVLRHLTDAGVDYPTCIAFRRDIDPGTVERRCERLAAADLVEPVSHEVVYRITQAGQRYLAARASQPTDDSRTTGERDQADPQTAGSQ